MIEEVLGRGNKGMKINDKLVTIGLCVYNGEEFVAEALESAVCQTHENLEILVFNDGSADNTLPIIKSFTDERIRIVDSKKNCGVVAARVTLKALAEGDYLVWLDADDAFYPDRVEVLLKHAVAHGTDLTCDVYRVMTHEGELLDRYYRAPEKVSLDKHFTRLFERNKMIPHPLISRRCYSSVEIDPEIKFSEDYNFWLKCSYAGYTFHQLDDVKLKYRLTDGSMSSNHERSRIVTKRILDAYSIDDLVELYAKRGFSEEISNYMVCMQYLFRFDYERALTFAMKDWPSEEDVDRDFYIGSLSLRNRDFGRAEKYLKRHLLNCPDSRAGHNNMGVLYSEQNRDGGAFFSKALDLLPEYSDAANNLKGSGKLCITDTQI